MFSFVFFVTHSHQVNAIVFINILLKRSFLKKRTM